MTNTSIFAAFERMWQHVVAIVGNKSDLDHKHDDIYDTKGSANTALAESNEYTNTAVSGKADKTYVDENFALKSEIRDISGSSANWLAKEGEDGYILNNPLLWDSTAPEKISIEGEWINNGRLYFSITAPIGLVQGKTYRVEWNDVSCIVEAKSVMDEYGNPTTEISLDNEYCYIREWPEDANGECGRITANDFSQGTFGIYQSCDPKLDNKYLNFDWFPIIDSEPVIDATVVTESQNNNSLGAYVATIRLDESYSVPMEGNPTYAVEVNGTFYEGIGTGSLDGDSIMVEDKFILIGLGATWMFASFIQGTYTFKVYEKPIKNAIPKIFLPSGLPYIESTTLLNTTYATPYTHDTFGKMWEITKKVDVRAGETYNIKYGNFQYNCVCYPVTGIAEGLTTDPYAMAMGNFSVVGMENTGEPFAMMISPTYERIDIIDLTGATSVGVSITKENIGKLNEKCLPNSLMERITQLEDALGTALTEVANLVGGDA